MDIKKFLARAKKDGRYYLTCDVALFTKSEIEEEWDPSGKIIDPDCDWMSHKVEDVMSFDIWTAHKADDIFLINGGDEIEACDTQGLAVMADAIESLLDISRMYYVFEDKTDGTVISSPCDGPFKTEAEAVRHAEDLWHGLCSRDKSRTVLSVVRIDTVMEEGRRRPVWDDDYFVSDDMITTAGPDVVKTIRV